METEKNTHNTKYALNIALAIYKKQGYARTVNVVGEETRKPNKELLIEQLANPTTSIVEYESNPELKQLFDLNKTLIFKKMAGSLTDYESQVLQILGQDKVKSHQLGVLSSIPLMYDNAKKKEARDESLEFFRENSKFVGNVGHKYYAPVEMLEKKWHDKGFYIYTFVQDEKHILKWFTGTDYPEYNPGVKLKINGIVKAHNDTNWYGQETLLKRCKLTLDVERGENYATV